MLNWQTIEFGEIKSIQFDKIRRRMQIGPRFYLLHGVKDVIVHDPFTQTVLHMRRDGTKYAISPTVIALACGCNVTV